MPNSATPSPAPSIPVGTVLAGRYVVIGPLGDLARADRGGWSEVYLVRSTNPLMGERRYVVKFPKATISQDLDFFQRFEREIRRQVGVRDQASHVVPILDADRHAGRPFCVLEYMTGGSLEGRIAPRVRGADGSEVKRVVLQTPAEVAAWVPKIADTVDAIHRQGIVHRDIKPANILFSAGGDPFLSDFGIAKAVAGTDIETMTPVGVLFYTPGYESPEMASGKKAMYSCDRYALAVTVYRALSGRLPHWPDDASGDYESPHEALRDLRRRAPARDVREIARHLSATVSRVVMRALDPSAEKRYASCRAFSDAFAAAAALPAQRAPTSPAGQGDVTGSQQVRIVDVRPARAQRPSAQVRADPPRPSPGAPGSRSGPVIEIQAEGPVRPERSREPAIEVLPQVGSSKPGSPLNRWRWVLAFGVLVPLVVAAIVAALGLLAPSQPGADDTGTAPSSDVVPSAERLALAQTLAEADDWEGAQRVVATLSLPSGTTLPPLLASGIGPAAFLDVKPGDGADVSESIVRVTGRIRGRPTDEVLCGGRRARVRRDGSFDIDVTIDAGSSRTVDVELTVVDSNGKARSEPMVLHWTRAS
jgi:serine/threonine-protein kinase